MVRLFIGVLLLISVTACGQTVTVAAAVSLKETISAIGDEFKKATGKTVEFAFGGSGQLLAQIRSGAPVDVFVSAAAKQMDDLQHEGLIVESSRRLVATNTLVLISPPQSTLASFDQLNGDAVKHLAMGQPKTVPAGEYAEQALRSLKLYEALQPKILFGSNVRQVLDYVTTGNADAGLVYATDANQAGDAVRVVATADSTTHEPIVYPAAVLKRASHAESAEQFLDFLKTPPARKILVHHGFGVPADVGAATRP